MRLLVISPKYFPDNFSVTPIAESFVKAGLDVTVLTSLPFGFDGIYYPDYLDKTYEEINGVKVHRVKVKTRKNTTASLIRNYLSVWKEFKRWVKKCKEDYDAVYSFGISPVLALVAGNIYKEKHHVPHYAHILDLWPDSVVSAGYSSKKSLKYRFLYKWSKEIYSKVDHLIVGSPSFAHYFEDVLKMENLNITYIPQPALSSFEKNELNPFDKNRFNILYCGNISTLQLVDYFVPAMEKVNNKNVFFNILGTGKDEELLKKMIEDSPTKDNIKFYGSVRSSDVFRYYLHADAVVVSLKNAGYTGKTIPNKLISCLYYSKPIIGMIDGDGRDVLIKAEGCVIADESIDSLSLAIDKISSFDEEKLKRMALNNYRYYLANFDLDIIVNKLLSLIVK